MKERRKSLCFSLAGRNGQWRDLWEGPDAAIWRRVWVTLTRHNNVIRMETAAEIRCVPIDAVQLRVATVLGHQRLKRLRNRQFVGVLITQIMVQRGWKPTTNVGTRKTPWMSRSRKFKREVS